MAKRRGNPNWCSPKPTVLGVTITSFDAFVRSLGLSPTQYKDSAPLKEWVKKHKDEKYVPLDLLEAWGLRVPV